MQRGITLIEVILIIVIVGILAALLLPMGGCLMGCGEGYSEGERTGIIVKCSRKGVFSSTKSWEAEMNLGGITSDGNGGFVGNIWRFTVEDEEVLKVVQDATRSQKPVTIRYTQWMCRPGCRSETGYFAKEIHYVEPPKAEKK